MTLTSTVERFCVWCNAERQVHAETGRCQTCGRSTARGDALPPPSNSLAPTAPTRNGTSAQPPVPEKLVLPETPTLRRWVELTRSLADGFQASAAKAADRARASDAESRRLANAAAGFAGLLAQIGLAEPAAAKSHPRRLPAGRWAREHEACVKCGKTDRPHKAHGLCARCHPGGNRP